MAEKRSGLQKKSAAEDRIAQLVEKRKIEAQEESARLIKSLLKRKEVFGEDFKLDKPYRTIAETEYVEIREYPPHKRTIQLSEKQMDEYEKVKRKDSQVHIQLPYTIFAAMRRHPQYGNGLYLGFRTSPLISIRNPIIFPTLPNTHHNCLVCQGSGGGHNFDYQVQNYWNSLFQMQEIPDGVRQMQRVFYKMDLWAELDLDEVNYRLNYYGMKIPLYNTCFAYGVQIKDDPNPIKPEEWAFMHPPIDVRGNQPYVDVVLDDDQRSQLRPDDNGRPISKKDRELAEARKRERDERLKKLAEKRKQRESDLEADALRRREKNANFSLEQLRKSFESQYDPFGVNPYKAEEVPFFEDEIDDEIDDDDDDYEEDEF